MAISPIQGIKVFSNYQICVTGGNLLIRNLATGVVHGKSGAVSSSTDRYQIVINKLVDMSVILINTNTATTEDVKAYEWNTSSGVFTTKSFTGLTSANFKCGAFYQGKLLLGGNPSAPSNLFYSKTFTALSLANIYDFSGYSGGAQPVGDGESIVTFATNNTEFFIFKKNSIFKITGDTDDKTTPSYAYVIKQETATGALNAFSVINVEKDIIYFDGATVRRISYESNIQALSDVAIGKDVESIVLTLSQSQEANSFMAYSYPFAKLYLRSNISDVNDFALLYNIVDKSFSIQQGVDANVGADGKVNNIRTCYIGSQFESVIYKDGVGTNYNEGDIRRSALSKRMNMGDGVGYNKFFEMELKGEITIGLDATISVLVDGKSVKTKIVPSDSSSFLPSTTGSAQFGSSLIGSNETNTNVSTTLWKMKIPLYNVGRDISYLAEADGQGIFDITGVTVTYAREKGWDIT